MLKAWGPHGWGGGLPFLSSRLLSHSPALTRELLTELAPASLFQMLMTSSAESLKLGHAIQPVVFGEALFMLETVVFPLPPPPSWSFVCSGNRHRCSSCLTQGHFPLIATLYADGFHLPQQLPSFSSLSFSNSPPPKKHPPPFYHSLSVFFFFF